MKEHEGKSIIDTPDAAAGRLYRHYTSTSALANGDLQSVLEINGDYFRLNFACHLPADQQAKILELGCGYGKNLHAMKKLGYSYITGVDFSEEQIGLAHSALGYSEVYFANAIGWLSQTKEMFDCIVLIDVLEHLDLSALVALGDMLETHLNPGGKVILQVPNDLAPLNPMRQGDLTHMRAFTPQSICQFFANFGLTVSFMGDTVSRNILKRILFKGVLSPLMKFAFRVLHGKYDYPLIFTANLIAVAKKPA